MQNVRDYLQASSSEKLSNGDFHHKNPVAVNTVMQSKDKNEMLRKSLSLR